MPIDRDFLEWLKAETEGSWRHHAPRRISAGEAGGVDWQTGTRWGGGMTDSEMRAAETRYGLAFPPDYRLFLATLHTPDPPMVGAFYSGPNGELAAAERRQMPDWTGDSESIEAMLGWPLEGLLWSIEQEDGWHPRWGPRPRGRRQREARVRRLAADGAQLIPIFGHRYLAGPGDRSDNPVLSIYGADVIVYGANLRSYLPGDLGVRIRGRGEPASLSTICPIPFWQDVIDGLVWPLLVG